MKRVLVIIDDVKLCKLLLEHLTREGFQVDTAHGGEPGELKACEGNYDVIVLDALLPLKNDLEVLSNIRTCIKTPIVMLLAGGDAVDRISGLERGADACLTKPFNSREFISIIRAVLRRISREQKFRTSPRMPRKIMVGDLEMNVSTRTVYHSGEALNLTSIEFNLLKLLLDNAGQIVSREELIQSVLGRSTSPYDRSIDVHISNLRKKLGHEASTERIKSVRGVGYLYAFTATSDN